MTNRKIVPSLIVALFVGGALTATAEGTVSEKFAAMDADSDGVVTEAEFVTYATASGKHTEEEAVAKFTTLAGDDGALSLLELDAAYTAAKSAEAEPAETTEPAETEEGA